MHKILTKWIEPYELLEEIKKSCLMKDYIFDGSTKKTFKETFLKELEQPNRFGLYMKNVNKFYLFEGTVNIEDMFGFTSEDILVTNDINKPFDMVDMGKAEAGFINI